MREDRLNMTAVHAQPDCCPLEHGHLGSGEGGARLSVAPMMDWTDCHCRSFHRLLSPHARLYTGLQCRRCR